MSDPVTPNPASHVSIEAAKKHLLVIANATIREVGRTSKSMQFFIEAINALPDMKRAMDLPALLQNIIVNELGKVVTLQSTAHT